MILSSRPVRNLRALGENLGKIFMRDYLDNGWKTLQEKLSEFRRGDTLP